MKFVHKTTSHLSKLSFLYIRRVKEVYMIYFLSDIEADICNMLCYSQADLF